MKLTDTDFELFAVPASFAQDRATLDEAAALKNAQIAEELALPPVKIHCSILAEDAIKAAIDDYRKKHGIERPAQVKAA